MPTNKDQQTLNKLTNKYEGLMQEANDGPFHIALILRNTQTLEEVRDLIRQTLDGGMHKEANNEWYRKFLVETETARDRAIASIKRLAPKGTELVLVPFHVTLSQQGTSRVKMLVFVSSGGAVVELSGLIGQLGVWKQVRGSSAWVDHLITDKKYWQLVTRLSEIVYGDSGAYSFQYLP